MCALELPVVKLSSAASTMLGLARHTAGQPCGQAHALSGTSFDISNLHQSPLLGARKLHVSLIPGSLLGLCLSPPLQCLGATQVSMTSFFYWGGSYWPPLVILPRRFLGQRVYPLAIFLGSAPRRRSFHMYSISRAVVFFSLGH